MLYWMSVGLGWVHVVCPNAPTVRAARTNAKIENRLKFIDVCLRWIVGWVAPLSVRAADQVHGRVRSRDSASIVDGDNASYRVEPLDHRRAADELRGLAVDVHSGYVDRLCHVRSEERRVREEC